MRTYLMATTAALLSLAAPIALADATLKTEGADLITNPLFCGGGGSDLLDRPVADMVMVDGFGAETFPADTQAAEAQAWFDHGIRLRWAFEHGESVRAFRKARLLDPECGMCAWGEAWALGPNLNGGGNDDASIAAAHRAAQDARRLTRAGTPIQKQLVAAINQRYSGFKSSRGRRFALTMDRMARQNPDNVTISAIAADAFMIKADDWWDEDGKAADPGITRAMTLLEGALQNDPDDPAAIHLYIHLTEWSDDPHKAIPYGEKLARLAPSASHLVHMPSHTFYRVGRYKDAMDSNVNAVALDIRYDSLATPPGGMPGMRLHAHNLHFGMGGALMAGGASEGVSLADSFMRTYPDSEAVSFGRQIMANNAYANYGRFADQAKVESLREPDADYPLLRVSWHYARGEAAARRGDALAVRTEATVIKTIRETTTFEGEMADFQSGFTEVSQRVLEGRAAMIEGNPSAAIAAFSRAAEIQAKGEEGGDPPAIWFPTRRSLAAALLADGKAADAKAKIEELLIDWPSDPYSLFVLAEAEAALGHADAAAAARQKVSIEWVGGAMDLKLA